MGFFGAARGWGVCGGRGLLNRSPSLKSVTHILQWWNLAQLYLTKRRSKKYMNHVTYPLSSADSIFSRKSANFVILRNKEIDNTLAFWYIISNFLESLKIVLIIMGKILMMSRKIATPGLLKVKLFRNKGFDVIISIHVVPNKILSGDSNYTVDVVMWPKFGNSSISMREVVTISIS